MCRRLPYGDDGLSLFEIMTLANKSKILNRVVVLDSCYSGIAGDHPGHEKLAELADGITILTASTAEQYASEVNGSGAFTALFVDALGELEQTWSETLLRAAPTHMSTSPLGRGRSGRCSRPMLRVLCRCARRHHRLNLPIFVELPSSFLSPDLSFILIRATNRNARVRRMMMYRHQIRKRIWSLPFCRSTIELIWWYRKAHHICGMRRCRISPYV